MVIALETLIQKVSDSSDSNVNVIIQKIADKNISSVSSVKKLNDDISSM